MNHRYWHYEEIWRRSRIVCECGEVLDDDPRIQEKFYAHLKEVRSQQPASFDTRDCMFTAGDASLLVESNLSDLSTPRESLAEYTKRKYAERRQG